MNSNSLTLRSINELLENDFIVPSYQRGYRWTELQVKELLDDLWEFAKRQQKNESDIYCLQPVVVKKNNESWELIDGQQRLTTIHIILSYINNNIFKDPNSTFSIEYATRPGSQKYLNEIGTQESEEYIDFHFFNIAFATVKTWFSQKGNQVLTATEFYPVLLNNTKIIWYELGDDEDPIEIFTRINIGKIPLTNSELIKALFLRKTNFSDQNDQFDKVRLKQIEIATEWDRIENSLQNPAFWYFLNDGNVASPNRIEFIFDLIAEEKNSELLKENRIEKERTDFFSFLVFNNWFETEKKNKSERLTIDRIWDEVKNYYMTFEEWFSNEELYHLIGYLICVGEKLKNLKNESTSKTKSSFKAYLVKKVNSHVNCQIKLLEYGRTNGQIRKVLLLFNIETLLKNQESYSRFPFDRFKIERWDIEHIHSVQSEMPDSKKHREDWLTEVNNYTQNAEISVRIGEYLSSDPLTQSVHFETLYTDIVKMYSTDDEDEDDVNDISNLALLNASINRGYKNAVFPIKRREILSRDKTGTFVPICTKNVFLKYYNEDIGQMSFWGKGDRANYLQAILDLLKNYLPTQN